MLKNLSFTFRRLEEEARTEAIQDSVVAVMQAYYRLHQEGRTSKAFPSVLAGFAAARYREGRRSTESMNSRNVLSPYARRRHNIHVQSLEQHTEREWYKESLMEDKRATPAETAAARLDFADWLSSLPQQDQELAAELSRGTSTKEAAERFQLSAGRISQKRRSFADSWHERFGHPEA